MPDTDKSLMQEFKEFILRGNVIDLAVAVVIGTAFTAVVNALVKDILTPLIAAIFGKPNFASLYFTIHKSRFLYGDVLNAIFTLAVDAAAIFFLVVKPLNYFMNRRKRAVEAGTEEPTTLSDEAVLLTEIRDLLRRQPSGPA